MDTWSGSDDDIPRYTSTGICTHPEQQIHSCQNIGSQFLISNQKFNVTFKHCEGMEWTKDKVGKIFFSKKGPLN